MENATSLTTPTPLTFLIATIINPDAASLLGTPLADAEGCPAEAVLAEPAFSPAELPELIAEIL